MKRKIKEIKRIARGRLQGQYFNLIRAMVFCSVIVSLVEMPFSMLRNEIEFSTQNIIYYIAVVLISIASVVLTAGQYRIYLTLSRTGEMHLSELFIPLKQHSNRFIFTQLLLSVFVLIALMPIFGAIAILYFFEDITLYIVALVLSIIGIVMVICVILNYDLVVLFMNDHEELSTMQALKYTKSKMAGNKGRYLYLFLSFTGMQLLNLISMGVANFWIQPYMMESVTIFYMDLNGELEEVASPQPMFINEYV